MTVGHSDSGSTQIKLTDLCQIMTEENCSASAAVLGTMQYQQFLQHGAQLPKGFGYHVRALIRFDVARTEKYRALDAPSGVIVHCFMERCPDEVPLPAHADTCAGFSMRVSQSDRNRALY
jgi:hypothetical protein